MLLGVANVKCGFPGCERRCVSKQGTTLHVKMVTRKIILILVSTTKFDFLSFMPKNVFYNFRNPFSTVFSLKIFEPFIAAHNH